MSENIFIFLLVIGCFAIGLGPVVWNHLRRTRALNKGVSANARVLEVKDTGRRHNYDPVVEIKLMVTDTTGREFPGQVKMPISAVRLTRYQAGKTVRVKYLPGSPATIAIDNENAATDS